MVPSCLVKQSLGVAVKEFFLDVINIKINWLWVKQIALHNVGELIQSVEGLKIKDRIPKEERIQPQGYITETLPEF